MKYHPPKSLHNQTEYWQFPPIQEVVNDLRMCGGRFKPWLFSHFGLDEECQSAAVVLLELARILNMPENEEFKRQFEDIRRNAETAATWLAEDTLYDQATSGRKEHQPQTKAFLERRLAGKWSTKGAMVEVKTKEAAEEMAKFEREYEEALANSDTG